MSTLEELRDLRDGWNAEYSEGWAHAHPEMASRLEQLERDARTPLVDRLAAALRSVLPAARANALRASTLTDADAVLSVYDATRHVQASNCATSSAFNGAIVPKIVAGFCTAAAWADSEDGTNPRFSNAERAKVEAYALAFMSAYPNLTRAALDCADYGWWQGVRDVGSAFGHDLYLTARGHGAGFADRTDTLGELARSLHDAIRVDWQVWGVGLTQYRGWLYLHDRACGRPAWEFATRDVVPGGAE